MSKITFLFFALFLTTTAFAQTYTVESVIDGDIIKLTNGETVGLIGINAPPITHGCVAGKSEMCAEGSRRGRESLEFVKGIVKPKHEIRLEHII